MIPGTQPGMPPANRDFNWEGRMAPTHLPLITSIAAVVEDDPALTGAASPQTITVHLKARSGQVYDVPLSEAAAQALTITLMCWHPVREYILDHFEGDDD
jgi:hypothetical protein